MFFSEWHKTLILPLTVVLALGQEPSIRREGSHWVQVITGTLPAPSGCRLKVENRGPVTVRGQKSNQISYTITKRVRARSEAEARALLRAAAVRATSRNGIASVALTRRNRSVLADMELMTRPDLAIASIESLGGDLQIYDILGDVEAETGAGMIQMDRIGADVSAKTGGGGIHLGKIGGAIHCFSGGGSIQVDSAGRESWLETAGGEISVRESAGPVHTSTAGGNIQVVRAGSTVSARTSGGRIEVMEARGIVLADNSGGSIQVGSSAGVRVASAGGSIRLKGSSGSLRAVTDVGSILAEFMNGARLQDSTLSTGNGDITVYIPSNLPLTVRALNESGAKGRIISEFSEIMVRQAAEAAQEGALAEGALNGGGPVLRLTSTGGTIYLKRQR